MLRWDGGKADKLIAINGLRWPVTTDGIKIQIECQCHEAARWAEFTDMQINDMASGALEFWHEFKSTILAMATYRASLGN